MTANPFLDAEVKLCRWAVNKNPTMILHLDIGILSYPSDGWIFPS